jgi:lipopolysaccharide biosynthesis protein
VLKLHTKKSPHRVDGDAWRISLWHGLLSDPASARRLAWHVATSTGAGCVLPAGNLLPFTADDPNWPLAEELLAHGPWPLQEATFPAGSMYWLSPPAVRAIATLPRWQHGAEVDDLDGTPSHVLERLVGIALRTHGLAIQTCEDVLAQERDAQLR